MLIKQLILTAACLLFNLSLNCNPTGAELCGNQTRTSEPIFSSLTLYGSAQKQLKEVGRKRTPFGSKSLADEHKSLLAHSCQPVSFYFLGRHAARFPKDEKIERYNKNLNDLQERLKKSSAFSKKCPQQYEAIIKWKTKLQPKQNFLITSLGGVEERQIASRFKQIYPKFFNASSATIDVGVTSKIRTSQTGYEFMKLVDGYKLPGCTDSIVPTNDVDQPEFNPDKILESSCYKNMMNNETEDFLQFHERCKKSKKKTDGNTKVPLIEKIKSPESVKRIVDKVSEKLSLQIDDKMLDSIYHMCAYETAIKNHSIWCVLLDSEDLSMMDYIGDVDAYVDESYGQNMNLKQTCPLMKNLLEQFEKVKNQNETQRLMSYFYFSHDHALKKIIPTFGLFKDDVNYSQQRVEDFISKGIVPQNRVFRTSVMVPFSSNFAFITYKCRRFFSDKPKYKILVALNEKPIKLAGCDNVVCDLQKFIDTYISAKDCNMEKICPL